MSQVVLLDKEAVRALGNPTHPTGDAHLGAAIQSAPADRITVVTSDPDDMRLVPGHRPIIVVAI